MRLLHRSNAFRGRDFGPGLVGLLAVASTACDGGGPGPVSAAVEDYAPPAVVELDRGARIENSGPRERLHIYDEPSGRGLQLLFMQNRGATPLPEGGVLWPDADGARLIRFDERGIVSDVVQGTVSGQRALTQPVFAAVDEARVLAIEPDGSGLLFEDGVPNAWSAAPFDGPVSGGSRARWAAARTILEFSLGPIRPEEPLMWASHREGELRPLGQVRVPTRRPFLGHLVNTGWAAADGKGRAYFASAIRPELTAFSTEGERLWTATWSPPAGVEEPSLGVRDNQATPLFAVYQFGLSLGEDGHIYVLAAPDPDEGPNRLHVFDRDGVLVRSGRIAERSAIFLGPAGHVYSIPMEQALARTADVERSEFADFDLPELGGDERLALEHYRGKVVVLNFWASWCGPCRREMPLLSEYAAGVDPSEVVVLGLNEDIRPRAAIEFIDEIGGVSYRNGEGGGDLRAKYNYRGLPYTVVLDREHRVVRSFYGFGESIAPIREQVEAEVAASTGS